MANTRTSQGGSARKATTPPPPPKKRSSVTQKPKKRPKYEISYFGDAKDAKHGTASGSVRDVPQEHQAQRGRKGSGRK